MEEKQIDSKEYYSIDLMQIFKSLLPKAWLIILVGIIVAAAGFFWSTLFIKPQYASSVMLYVNNGSFSETGSGQITTGEMNAAQQLVNTYGVILKSKTTLREVIKESGVDYSFETLSKMISSNAENDTEIMRVTVTCTDADEAAKIANAIAAVLPDIIAENIERSSVKIVEYAEPDYDKVSPSITKYTVGGFFIGVMLMIIVLAVIVVADDTIRDEDYIVKTCNYPVLAKIPDLTEVSSKHYGGYYARKTSVASKNNERM